MIQSTGCFECEGQLDYFDGIIMCLSCREKYHVPLLPESNREDMLAYSANKKSDRPEPGTVILDAKTKSKSMSPEDLLTWIQAGGKIESG